ncbi:hypothetical protein T09_6882 [Trichinella sp. T9]|nr:hypothetical protein T09_6882 [Trichinella sp. T9]
MSIYFMQNSREYRFELWLQAIISSFCGTRVASCSSIQSSKYNLGNLDLNWSLTKAGATSTEIGVSN